jgi:hypothetical protein
MRCCRRQPARGWSAWNRWGAKYSSLLSPACMGAEVWVLPKSGHEQSPANEQLLLQGYQRLLDMSRRGSVQLLH